MITLFLGFSAVGSLFRALMNLPIFQSALRPITRLTVGLIAIPIFRFVMRRVFRLHDLNDELEKDLEHWFRGALLLLAATANMEHLLFGWLTRVDWLDRADWFTMGLRLLLAIGVIEAMPDQEIFAVIHPGPPRLTPGRSVLREIWQKKRAILKGIACRHLNRSSPVLAMMCAIVGAQLPMLPEDGADSLRQYALAGWAMAQPVCQVAPAEAIASATVISGLELEVRPEVWLQATDFERHWERWLVGWVCYFLAITQYLIIGLVTSRDRAMDVLSEFDRAVAERRTELIREFQLAERLGLGDQVSGSVNAVAPDPARPNPTTKSQSSGTPAEPNQATAATAFTPASGTPPEPAGPALSVPERP